MTTRELLYATLIPGLITGIGLLATWMVWQLFFRPATTDRSIARGPLWAVPVAFTLAYLAAYYGFNPSPELWPANATYRVHAAAAAAGAIGLIHAITPLLPARLRWGGRLTRHPLTLALGAFIALAFLAPLSPRVLSAGLVAVIAAACALWLTLSNSTLDAVARRMRGWAMPAVLLPLAGAAIPVFLYSAYSVGARFAAAIVAILCAALVVGLICRSMSLERGGVLTILAALLSLGLIAQFFNYHPRTGPLLLLAAAPFASAVALFPLHGRRTGPFHKLAPVGAVAIVAGAAALWAYLGKPALEPYPY